MAFPIALIPAIISAVAAAGTGVAGAVQAGDSARAQSANDASNRAMQMRIAKMQIKAQQEQQLKDQQQAAMSGLSSLYDERSQLAQALAQRQIGANGDAMNSISKAFLRGRA